MEARPDVETWQLRTGAINRLVVDYLGCSFDFSRNLGRGGKMTDLQKLSDAAAPGDWAYRPDKYDDWGTIRSGEIDSQIGRIRPPVAKTSPLWHDYDFDAHREAGTDPMEANGRFVVELVNAFREGRLIEK